MATSDSDHRTSLHLGRWEAVRNKAIELCRRQTLKTASIVTGTVDVVAGYEFLHESESFPVRWNASQSPASQSSPDSNAGSSSLSPSISSSWNRIETSDNDPIFLIASITKPIVAIGALLLVERGEIALADRVTDYIPDFGRNGKHAVEIRHLLTHTSGLCDMLPDNVELRQAQAPLTKFVERTCEEPLSFPPGRSVQYQSMGFSILGEIIHRVSGKTCAEFLDNEFFQPLEMNNTALGAPDAWFEGPSPKIKRIPESMIPIEQVRGDQWNWNSRYWRQLGAPWGGLLASPLDLVKFAQFLLRTGTTRTGHRLVSKATISAATRNQLACMRDLPEEERRCRPWGLGWRLNWPAHSANFGDLLGPNTYGHWGATGTVMWMDPDRKIFTVILTTTPQEPSGRWLSRLSNMISAAWV